MNNNTTRYRIGIDLGGTKTEIIVLADDGEVKLRRRMASPREDYPASVQTICQLVHDAEQELDIKASVGVATPGAISRDTGCIKNANSTWLNGRPLRQDLEENLQRSVRIANDANCFALSEAVDGAAEGAATVFGVIIGTGTGGGIVVNGKPLQGINGIAGEWGHNPLPWPNAQELPGPACYCGKHCCLETWLSGPGFVRDYAREVGEDDQLDAVAIVDLALQGDKVASLCLQRYSERLARGLASVINVLDPEVIVLGGGMSNIQFLYQDVPRLWQQYVFSDTVHTRLLPPVHGDSSGVRGAAWLWP